MRPRLLDLFCCEGGAATGYARAGFDVIGVDLEPQPLYPFPVVVADALEPPFDLRGFDAIHASPPCQGYTTMSNRHGSSSPLLIDAVRAMLQASGVPWVIENVTGARRYMRSPVMLHGGMFGLGVWRPRLFEQLSPDPRRVRGRDGLTDPVPRRPRHPHRHPCLGERRRTQLAAVLAGPQAPAVLLHPVHRHRIDRTHRRGGCHQQVRRLEHAEVAA